MTRFLHEIHSNNEFGEERKWSEMNRLHCFSVSYVSKILLFALLLFFFFCGNWAVGDMMMMILISLPTK